MCGKVPGKHQHITLPRWRPPGDGYCFINESKSISIEVVRFIYHKPWPTRLKLIPHHLPCQKKKKHYQYLSISINIVYSSSINTQSLLNDYWITSRFLSKNLYQPSQPNTCHILKITPSHGAALGAGVAAAGCAGGVSEGSSVRSWRNSEKWSC